MKIIGISRIFYIICDKFYFFQHGRLKHAFLFLRVIFLPNDSTGLQLRQFSDSGVRSVPIMTTINCCKCRASQCAAATNSRAILE